LSFLTERCTFSVFSEEIIKRSDPFDFGHKDINDFFKHDSPKYSKELLGKSYCFVLDENPNIIVCAFTISNDSIKANFLPNNRKRKITKRISREKHFRSYPAVLIGRLGVNKEFRHNNIGSELMDFIKSWFIDPNNKTGCRFVVVDSYNEEKPLNYYKKNQFEFLFSSEEQESDYTGQELPLITRLMYFDLIVLSADFVPTDT